MEIQGKDRAGSALPSVHVHKKGQEDISIGEDSYGNSSNVFS